MELILALLGMGFALFMWIFLCILVGAVAGSRGRGSIAWTFISMLISPLIGVILVMILPSYRRRDHLVHLADDRALRRNIENPGKW